jgi:oxazoline/thiazoline synthase
VTAVRHPRLAARFQARVVAPDRVVLVSERENAVWHGAVHAALVPLLDGRRSVDRIVDRLGDRFDPAEVYYALIRLEAGGYLREVRPAGPAEVFRDAAGSGVAATPRVTLRSWSRVGRARYTKALEAAGIGIGQRATALDLVTVDDYLDDRLAAHNREALTTERPWVPLAATGTVAWLGPVFRPGETACWECLAHRIRRNRDDERIEADDRPVPRGWTGASLRAAIGLFTVQLERWAAGDGGLLGRYLLTFDLVDASLRRHRVDRRPQCPVCGDAGLYAQRVGVAPALSAARVGPRLRSWGTGRRRDPPEVFAARHGALVDDVTGVIRDLAPLEVGAGLGVHAYAAGANSARVWGGTGWRSVDLRMQCGGKGTTDAEARASAMAEAIERYSGVFQGDEPRVRSTFRALGDRAIHPNECLLFSPAQYRGRRRWNARVGPTARVPTPFDPESVVDWTPVWSLTRRAPRYLPTALLYFGHPEADPDGFGWADSNGCAAGETFDDAVLAGLLELIERDAVAIWWYNRLRLPGVDLGRIDDPWVRGLVAAYRTLGRRIWVLDATSDVGVPTYVALSCEEGRGADRIVFGMGAHLDPAVALRRSLAEMGQLLAAALELDRDRGAARSAVGRWLREAVLREHPHLSPRPGRRVGLPRSLASVRGGVAADLGTCRARLERLGLDLLVLDQTRPDIGVPVVKMIVPGLRHFWARFGAGRLYDVPVRLGRRRRRIAERSLNPVPLFV